jgi:import inner membrane translocase subunit TIM21
MQHTRHPQTQNEHLIMRFWVHGRGIDEVETLGWLYQPFRDARGWLQVQYEQLMEQYLMDRLDGDGSQDHVKTSDQVDVSQQQQQQESSWFGGMFGALKPSSQGSSRNGITGKGRKALPPP